MRKQQLFLTLIILAVVGMTVSCFHASYKTHPYSFQEVPYFPPMPVADSNMTTEEGVALGRLLFYDPVLSIDSNMACANCHHQHLAFSDAPLTSSKGFQGAPTVRNTPAIFNLAWYERMFWDGRAPTIEEQVFHPVRAKDEMNITWNEVQQRINASPYYMPRFQAVFGDVPVDSMLIANAIAQFMRTIISSNSKFDRVMAGTDTFSNIEYAGYLLFKDTERSACANCHTIEGHALFTTGGFADNGLQDAPDHYTQYKEPALGGLVEDSVLTGHHKIPSLRNIELTGPYMHDGRFKTLDEVLDFYSTGVHNNINIGPNMTLAPQGGAHFSELEKEQIKAFLLTLTDPVLTTDTAYSNPFK